VSKHTPGPWKGGEYPGDMTIDGPDGKRIVGGCGCCNSPWGVTDDAECTANARLIAAAPDMYALIERLAGGDCDGNTVWDKRACGQCVHCRARAIVDAVDPIAPQGATP
jgi:hypothetical protein